MALAGVTPSDWPGLLVWAAMVLGVAVLPGGALRLQGTPPFPWSMGVVWLCAVAGMASLLGLLLVVGGSRWGRARFAGWIATVPAVVLCGAVLLLWPRAWGMPGLGAWIIGFLLVTLPGEWRWLAQGLPRLPNPYGPAVARRMRRQALVPLMRSWVAVRWPVWLMGSLLVERVLGVTGPASDFALRLAIRDRVGSAAWVVLLAICWWAGRRMVRWAS